MNCVAQFATREKHCVLLTTHSPSVLSRVPLHHIRMLRRTPEGVETGVPAVRSAALQPLGLDLPKRAVLLVEDRVAKWVLTAIVGCIHSDLLSACSIQTAEGKDGVLKAVQDWPIPHDMFGGVGVLDGDSRRDGEAPPRIVFLPGTKPPEAFIRDALISASGDGLVHGRSQEDLRKVDMDLEGLDHHDRFLRFAERLGVSPEALVFTAVGLLAHREPDLEVMKRFVDELAALLQT